MEYTSFYGGRRGASFVIVKSYPSVAEMVAAFSQGGAYKTVGYDEYVIIDTVDKNDIDNGKIYRRGYDFNNEVGGAEYIGQIVGPDGAAPHVEMKTYQEVEDLYAEHGPVDPATGDEYRKSEGEYAPSVNLVPGEWIEDGEEKFNDAIKWVTCSIRDEHSNSSTVHVGFIIPYMVVNYTAKSVDPYFHRSNETEKFDNERLVYREDNKQHPYYESWHLDIPKGIKGDAIKNLRVTTVAECNEEHPGWLQEYAGMSDDEVTEAIKKERKIMVYDYYHFDKEAEGEPVSIYLGDYNEITNIDLAENGTLTIDYSHNDEDVWDRAFKWVKSVQLDTETGHFTMEFNHDQDVNGEPTIYETDLRWVKDIEFQENGSVNLVYTTNTDPGLEYDRLIKWIKEVTLDPETGKLTVKYNYDETPEGEPTIYEQDLKWVKDVSITDTGTVTFDYTVGDDKVYNNKIKWIKEIKLNPENGKLEVIYNYDQDPESGLPTKFETDLRWVKDITVDSEGTVFFDYTTGNDVTLSRLIKWIKDISLDPNTGEFTINYNHAYDANGEPTVYKQNLRWVNEVSISEDGTVTFDYTNGEDTVYKNMIKYIKRVELNGETGHLTVTYNQDTDAEGNPTIYETDLRWVNSINLAEDGTVTLKYTTGADVVLDNKIKWITQTTLDPDGTLTINYNNGTKDVFSREIKWIDSIIFTDEGHLSITYNNGTPTLEKDIIWLTDVELQTGEAEGQGNQKVKVTFNNGVSKELGMPINYIMQTAIDNRYHLLVLYSDPARRQEIKTYGRNATWLERDDWYDLGYIGNGTGVGAIAGKESDEGVAAIAATLTPYSVWFIIDEDE